MKTKEVSRMIKVGDKVFTRFGSSKIIKIDLCKEGDREGIQVNEIFEDLINRCVFDLDCGHWVYGDQIEDFA